jgi:hypothetical protein
MAGWTASRRQLLGSLICSVWAVSASVSAAEPPTVDAKQLGITESTLRYCEKADVEVVSTLREKVKSLMQGASAVTVASARNSIEYRTAFDSVTDFVGKLDPHNAKLPCKNAASTKPQASR